MRIVNGIIENDDIEMNYDSLRSNILDEEANLISSTKEEKYRTEAINKNTLKLADFLFQNSKNLSMEEKNQALENLSFRCQDIDNEKLNLIKNNLKDVGLLDLFSQKFKECKEICGDDETPKTNIKFPEEILTGTAGAFAKAYGEYLETPLSFLFMNYLTCLGLYSCDKICLDSELEPQPRFYTVCVGESAETRKSTSIEHTVKFWDEVWQEKWLCYGVGSAEGLAKSFKDSQKILLYLDELKAIISKMRIEGAILLPCINSLFQDNRFHTKTQKHTIQLDNVYLSLIAACTLDTFQNLFTSQFLDIGFVNRLFVVLDSGKRKYALPERIPTPVKVGLTIQRKKVIDMVDNLSKKGKFSMKIDSSALKIFKDWYFALPSTPFTKRLDTYGHRMMPMLSINDNKEIIDNEIVEKTISLLRYEYKVRELTDPIDTVNAVARLEESIRRTLSKHGELSRRDLGRAVHKNRYGQFIWNVATGNLKECGEIKEKNKKFYLVENFEEKPLGCVFNSEETT